MSALPDYDTRAIQRALNQHGYDVGAVDGQFGPRTQAQLEHYMTDNGIPPGPAQDYAQQMRAAANRPPSAQPAPPTQAAASADRASRAGTQADSTMSPAASNNTCPCATKGCPSGNALGVLSKNYESGARGASAIGYDDTGGWSYGTYQIATKNGTMNSFLNVLTTDSPDLAKKLTDAGGGPAALAGASSFKSAWTAAALDPAFTTAQHDFAHDNLYAPLVNKIGNDTGLAVEQRSPAVQNMVWSIAVQHGARNSVVDNALKGKDVSKMSDDDIIDAVYDERSAVIAKDGKQTMKYFSKSKPEIQKSVKKRFEKERACAHKMEWDDQHRAATAVPPAATAV